MEQKLTKINMHTYNIHTHSYICLHTHARRCCHQTMIIIGQVAAPCSGASCEVWCAWLVCCCYCTVIAHTVNAAS